MTCKQSGYTLIEILVVLLIISIVASAALLTLHYNQNKQIENVAQEITNLLSLASEEAMLRPATLGVFFADHTYSFAVYQENNEKKPTWTFITTAPLNTHHYANDIQITVDVAHTPAKNQPTLVIDANGDMTPFTLRLGTHHHKPHYQITQTRDGTIKSEPVHEK